MEPVLRADYAAARRFRAGYGALGERPSLPSGDFGSVSNGGGCERMEHLDKWQIFDAGISRRSFFTTARKWIMSVVL